MVAGCVVVTNLAQLVGLPVNDILGEPLRALSIWEQAERQGDPLMPVAAAIPAVRALVNTLVAGDRAVARA